MAPRRPTGGKGFKKPDVRRSSRIAKRPASTMPSAMPTIDEVASAKPTAPLIQVPGTTATTMPPPPPLKRRASASRPRNPRPSSSSSSAAAAVPRRRHGKDDPPSSPSPPPPRRGRRAGQRRICRFCSDDPVGIGMHASRPCDWQDGVYPIECTNCADHRALNPVAAASHICFTPRVGKRGRTEGAYRKYSVHNPARYEDAIDTATGQALTAAGAVCVGCASTGRALSCDVDPILGYNCSLCKAGHDCVLPNGRVMETKPNVRQGVVKWFRHACDGCAAIMPRRPEGSRTEPAQQCSWLVDRTTWDGPCDRCRDNNLACLSSAMITALPPAIIAPDSWAPRSFLAVGWTEMRRNTVWRKYCANCRRDNSHCRASMASPYSACNRCTAMGLNCVGIDGIAYPIFDLSQPGFGYFMPFTQCRRCATMGRNCDRQRPCDSCTNAGEAHLCDNAFLKTDAGKRRMSNCIRGRLDPPPGPLYYLALGYGAGGVDDVKDGSQLEHWIGPYIETYAMSRVTFYERTLIRAVTRDREYRIPESRPPHAAPGTPLATIPGHQLTAAQLAGMIQQVWPEAVPINTMPRFAIDRARAIQEKPTYTFPTPPGTDNPPTAAELAAVVNPNPNPAPVLIVSMATALPVVDVSHGLANRVTELNDDDEGDEDDEDDQDDQDDEDEDAEASDNSADEEEPTSSQGAQQPQAANQQLVPASQLQQVPAQHSLMFPQSQLLTAVNHHSLTTQQPQAANQQLVPASQLQQVPAQQLLMFPQSQLITAFDNHSLTTQAPVPALIGGDAVRFPRAAAVIDAYNQLFYQQAASAHSATQLMIDHTMDIDRRNDGIPIDPALQPSSPPPAPTLPYNPFSPPPPISLDTVTMPGHAMMMPTVPPQVSVDLPAVYNTDLLDAGLTALLNEAQGLDESYADLSWLQPGNTDPSGQQTFGVNPFDALPLAVEQQQQQNQQQNTTSSALQSSDQATDRPRWRYLNPMHDFTDTLLGQRDKSGAVLLRKPFTLSVSHLVASCAVRDKLYDIPEPAPEDPNKLVDMQERMHMSDDNGRRCEESGFDVNGDGSGMFLACGDPAHESDRCASADHRADLPSMVCDGCAQQSTQILVDPRFQPLTAAEVLSMRAYLCRSCAASSGASVEAMLLMCEAGINKVYGMCPPDAAAAAGSSSSSSTNADGSVDVTATDGQPIAFYKEARPMTGCSCGIKMFKTRQCQFHRIDHAEALLQQVAAVQEWRIQTGQQGKCAGCFEIRSAADMAAAEHDAQQLQGSMSAQAMSSWVCLACGGWVMNQQANNTGKAGLVAGWRSWFRQLPASLTTVYEESDGDDMRMMGV